MPYLTDQEQIGDDQRLVISAADVPNPWSLWDIMKVFSVTSFLLLH